MTKFALIVLAVGLLTAPISARADHSLVLIAHIDSPLDDLSSLSIRKLYLGFTVVNDEGDIVHAIVNSSDSSVWEIFLQDVMGMSARSYDRRLLTLTLQSGRSRPEVVNTAEETLDKIDEDKNAVAFVWSEDIEGRNNIKVLRVLWQD